jgi:hypothetical protein
MNRLESLVYHAVKQNPKVKTLIRDVYQAVLYPLPVPKEKSVYPVTVREGFFFGFHDKKPWSQHNKFLLAHRFNNLKNKIPKPEDTVDIGFFKGEDHEDFQKIALTSCFNWQQGSMLQWIGKSDRFIFNDAGGDDNIARIFDTDGKALGTLPKSIGAVSPDGTKALSYNFARFREYFPGYEYAHGTDPEMGEEQPSSHGISLIDIENNLVTKLFSIKEISSILPEKSMTGAFHFLTHTLFSPSGNRFLFLHRWLKDKNFRYTRLLSCDVNGKDLHVFPTHEMVSHIAWQDESHVLAWCRSMEKKDAYILFRDMSDEHHLIGTEVFTSDGHPSFPGNKPEWFLTDTYPDRLQRSYLFIYNILQKKRYDLGYFRQPFRFRDEVSCDLHPRWNHEGTKICFDSAHTGKRSLCTMNLGDLLTKSTSSQG